MQQNLGIILKTYFPNKQKIIIFNQAKGKLELWVDHKSKNLNLANGMLINYDQNKQLIKNINIIDAPFDLAKINILFFHHVLELCYYFIPFGMEDFELFEFLYFLFYSCIEIENLQLQKIILGKFFSLVGLYPDDGTSNKYFYQLSAVPIDKIADMQIDLNCEKELDLWIIKCINMHPYAKSFKTMHFLNKIVIS